MPLPRPEYPRPQFVRDRWLCLNGEWEFEIDAGDSGLARGLLTRPLSGKITVPFCPESPLSGVGNPDFLNAVWYRRRVKIPADWRDHDVLLHFGAVDYDSTVWINGQELRRHRGGFSPFTCELRHIPGAIPGNEIEIVLRARDSSKGPQPRGKQSDRFEGYNCVYTRTTGIWQTVWLEPVPACAFRRPRITPDVANTRFRLELPLSSAKPGYKIKAALSDAKGLVGDAVTFADHDFCPALDLPIPAERVRLWSPTDPHLYDIQLDLLDDTGRVVDSVKSYAGLRSIRVEGKAVLINGQRIFQRLVLDQGYYPDGIMTAPTDEALKRDIELSMELGFNGARLHQKVFEERFLYYCDKLGYLVWGEFGDWGCGKFNQETDNQQPGPSYITEWLEVLDRDYSHPAIIGWCPLNETNQTFDDTIHVLDDVTRGMFLAAKNTDRTRPVLDASGYAHRVYESDIYDTHDYGSPDDMAKRYPEITEGKFFRDTYGSHPYRGQPFFVSEFGGIWWERDMKSMPNGEPPRTLEQLYQIFEKACALLLNNPEMFGYCFTQLTDVFQEQNGIYRFDRTPKFDLARIRAAQVRPAAYES
jgi:beta-galactosidase/beta-glucuronidase